MPGPRQSIHQLDRDHAWHAVRIALIGCGAVAGWSSRGCYDAGQRRQVRLLVRDLSTGTDTRVPMPQASPGMQTGPGVTWTPAGRLLYASGGVDTMQIYDCPADGSGSGRPLVAGMSARYATTGRRCSSSATNSARAVPRPILADGTAGNAELVFAGADERRVPWFDISADGTLLAFTTIDAMTGPGQLNIFVATYPDLRQRRQVTAGGGTQPRFSHDGRQLYYISPTRRPDSGIPAAALSMVTLTTKPLTSSAPRMLMVDSASPSGGPTPSGFDVAADGRLLMTRVAPAAPGEQARTPVAAELDRQHREIGAGAA